jgi:hypothetical protein
MLDTSDRLIDFKLESRVAFVRKGKLLVSYATLCG